jgi:hypothetical protein
MWIMMSSTEKLEKLLAIVEINETNGSITINGDLYINGKLTSSANFINDPTIVLKDMPASLDKTIEIKNIKQFPAEYPNSVGLLTSYPTATHYGVDGRGDLVLYKNNKPLVFIKSVTLE